MHIFVNVAVALSLGHASSLLDWATFAWEVCRIFIWGHHTVESKTQRYGVKLMWAVSNDIQFNKILDK